MLVWFAGADEVRILRFGCGSLETVCQDASVV